MSSKINQNSTLKDVLDLEEAEDVLRKYNLPCLSCPMAKFEIEKLRLGDVCKMYGIEVETLIKELNKTLKGKNKK